MLNLSRSLSRSLLISSSSSPASSSAAAAAAAVPLRTSSLALRRLSSSASSSSIPSAAPKPGEKILPKKASDDNNVFLDNLGKIFGLSIGALIIFVVRSSQRTSNQTAVKDKAEEESCLDPVEIEEMRAVNVDLTEPVFASLVTHVHEKVGAGNGCTYPKFMALVKAQFAKVTDDGTNTVQLGHYLDRVVLNQPGYDDDKEYPLSFLFTVLSLALFSPVEARLNLLYKVLQLSSSAGSSPGSSSAPSPLPAPIVYDFITVLRDTCQLPPESHPVEDGSPYPVQKYKTGTGEEILNSKLRDEKDADKAAQSRTLYGGVGDDVTEEMFKRIMRSKAVCAWGECYVGIRRRNN